MLGIRLIKYFNKIIYVQHNMINNPSTVAQEMRIVKHNNLIFPQIIDGDYKYYFCEK